MLEEKQRTQMNARMAFVHMRSGCQEDAYKSAMRHCLPIEGGEAVINVCTAQGTPLNLCIQCCHRLRECRAVFPYLAHWFRKSA